MQHTVELILLIAAIVLFLMSTFGVTARINLASLGLACFAGAFLVGLL
jgi:FtsH-binding integral membrane protein